MKNQDSKNRIDDSSLPSSLSSSSFITILSPTMNHSESSREHLWAQLQELQRTEMEQLKEEQEKLQHEKDTMNALAAANSKNGDGNGDDDIVEINVGGQLFLQVLRSTLCLPSDTMFSFMFSGRWEGSLIRDDQGRIFFDHDPELVEVIVNFLRMRKIEQGSTTLKKSKSKPVMRSPRIPEGKKEDFMSLLDHFELTEFFYPSPLPDVKASPPSVVKSSSLDIAKINVFQSNGSLVDVVKSENNIKCSYNGSNRYNFVACTPSLDSSGEGSFCKVTINSLPTRYWIEEHFLIGISAMLIVLALTSP